MALRTTHRRANRPGMTYVESDDDDVATADANSTVLGREGSATPRTFVPVSDHVDFDAMTSS